MIFQWHAEVRVASLIVFFNFNTNNTYFFLPITLCFISVYIYYNPKTTPYSNADTLNIVVQREKKDVRMRSKPR